MSLISGLFKTFQSASLMSSAASAQAASIRTGGEIAAQGALLSAAGYRESIKAVQGATEFNLGVDSLNLQRQLSATSRQFQRTVGKQLNQQATTGISVTSKSFLQLRSEASNIFGTAMLNMKVDAENKRRATIFESQVKQTNLENQARAAEYRAEAERVMAANRAAQAEYQGDVAAFKGISKAFTSILGTK